MSRVARPRSWFLVPARGGSKGIPQKNLRLLAGRPLVAHVLDTIRSVYPAENIVLSTDDDEIAAQVPPGARVHRRSPETASDSATLDAVAVEVAGWLMSEHGATTEDVLVTIQPTAPFLTTDSVRSALALLERATADTVLSVRDDRHLRWGRNAGGEVVPLFGERVNRQALPVTLAETGGLIACRIKQVVMYGTRIGARVELLEVSRREGLDIDDYTDWAVAEYLSRRIRLLVRADSSSHLGYGHVYRALALAEELAEHDVTIAARCDGDFSAGFAFLESRGARVEGLSGPDEVFRLVERRRPELIINDILDTDAGYIRNLKDSGAFVVNFEDLGSGIQEADIVVNDLYPDTLPSANHWYGVRYAILNPAFDRIRDPHRANDTVERILLAFGGTDPNQLTCLALRAVHDARFTGEVLVILGPGFSHDAELADAVRSLPDSLQVEICRNVDNMAALMAVADLAVTSAGRTVTELMTVGVPTIAICQNLREMRHSHASSAYGVINLGLGELLSVSAVAQHIRLFIDDAKLRHDMTERMRRAVAGRSNKRIVEEIITEYQKWRQGYVTSAH